MQERPSSPPSPARLWFALLGGGIAWTIHLFLAYAIAEFGCVGAPGVRWAGLTAVAWLLAAMTLPCLALAAVSLLAARRCGGSWQPDGDGPGSLARIAVILNGLFFGIILLESLPILFYLTRC